MRSIVYLHVEDLEGASQADIEALQRSARALNDRRLIDYDRVFEMKSKALRKVFDAAPAPRGLATYLAREGAALRDYAVINADHDVHHNPPEFHAWVQYHLDRQLAAGDRSHHRCARRFQSGRVRRQVGSGVRTRSCARLGR